MTLKATTQITDAHFHEIILTDEVQGLRLDQALALLFPQYSRTRLQHWIKLGNVKVNQQTVTVRHKCIAGEIISLNVALEKETHWQAEKSDLTKWIVMEDDYFLVINKPVGLVVHPGAGNLKSTLANQLLDYYPPIEQVPRAGIVHRLDKNTSGLMIVAKTLEAQTAITQQLSKREVQREYNAITVGVMISGGTIDLPIGRNSTDRQKMAVVQVGGKNAITHYRVIERFRAHTFIRVMLETGRTHQIRVHLAYKHFPLLGDALYGAKNILPKGATPQLIEALGKFKHQALHAKKIIFFHPFEKKMIELESALPEDFQSLVTLLRENSKGDNNHD